MITSELIKIEYTNDNELIEQKLAEKGIIPLRWAIISLNNNNMTLCVSYEK